MDPRFDMAVCIGRFQLPHEGHVALLRQALASAPRCVVILGSAHQARSPRNPFTWKERAEMIRLALAPAEFERVDFVPLRDTYDMARWATAVRAAVGERSSRQGRIALVGHRKDATSDYLAEFPDWTLVNVGGQGDIHAKDLRAALFSADSIQTALAAMASQVPASTVEFLRAWAQMRPEQTPGRPMVPCAPLGSQSKGWIGGSPYDELCEEWRALAKEQAKWKSAPYPPVFVTVDAVLRMAGHVLLIRRGRAPGKGCLALPGGFLEQRETVYQSAIRELEEETGLKFSPSDMRAALKAVQVFDHPDRSQRGRVITHAHYFEISGERLPAVTGLDDAAEALWVPVEQLASMGEQFHDDHFHILDVLLGLNG